ncbi:DUF429 domain-containing protein [Rhodococcus sp. P1Y]|uniref:DUF429 domain-containing protein n=1 Tax=Rhodococcus sp. P1Y TaxID=1302308 RepID=UPI000EAFB6F5|nr:DUF429 domain-containing protein [Rhodococcus sp. P1Y]AYJ50203.1 DUF429 domain-containing protein [Rhodococcus sp. P1Y]
MSSHTKNTVAGVDGAKGEWVVALFDGTRMDWTVAGDVAAVLDSTHQCTTVGVDMPLHMPTSGYRTSELAAKQFLGPARSSIFHTPVAAVLDAETYSDACEISRSVTGKAISKQTWYLLAGVRAWRDATFDVDRVVEVHPECTFRSIAPTIRFATKKSARGAGQRLSALAAWVDTANIVDGLAALPPGPVLDDALDAAAAAVSAWRYSRDEHRVFGAGDDADRIVA